VNPVYKPLPNSPLARPSTQPLPALPIPTRSPAPQLDSLPSPSPSAPSPVRTPSSAPSAPQSPSPSVLGLPRASAPYRPGFQPKGVYRPRTDEFIAARAHTRTAGRVERARLERRLEKLVALHFGPEEEKPKPSPVRPAPASPARRASSFFESIDFSELRSKGAGELWRGVVQSQAVQGSAKEIRAAEQRITPWEEDSSVSACPFCTYVLFPFSYWHTCSSFLRSASFHPLTNRKHHCRMCGRIMCSLPPKAPQRPEPCSILFVADSKTGRIEEVSEGVDYGVRRRQSSTGGDDERFLRGVRICKECRPVLL
jgi:rabenosyn-5